MLACHIAAGNVITWNTVRVRILCDLELLLLLLVVVVVVLVVEKSKAIPLQAWTDPEDSRRTRLPNFKTIGTRRW